MCLEDTSLPTDTVYNRVEDGEFDHHTMFDPKCTPDKPCTWSTDPPDRMCAVCLLAYEAQLSSQEDILMRLAYGVADRLYRTLSTAWWRLRDNGTIGPSAFEERGRHIKLIDEHPLSMANLPPLFVANFGGGPSRWPAALPRPRSLTPREFAHIERMPCMISAMLRVTSRADTSLPPPAPDRAHRLLALKKKKGNKFARGKKKP